MRARTGILLLIVGIALSSCKYYSGHIMFETDGSVVVDSSAMENAEGNYRIQSGDRVKLRVYGNDGELLVDPDDLMKQELNLLSARAPQEKLDYLVMADGSVDFPVVGNVMLQGKTINEANKELADMFEKYYPGSFVYLSLENRRVVVFGSAGGQIVPLENENMSLLEVLAISGEVKTGSYSHNIRVIRGNLENPNVMVIDLSTIEGMKQSHLQIKPNDIVYVEPKKVLVSQAISQSISPILGILNTVLISIALFRP